MGQQLHAYPVGRTIFQKICDVLTELGVKTGVQFTSPASRLRLTVVVREKREMPGVL